MRYSVFAGGKRLRPCLTIAAAEAVDSVGARRSGSPLALPAACAIEMLHTYSLIHDDLPAMDNDTLRRGRATLHVVHGEGIAILAGDGLHAEAFTLLAREPADDDAEISRRKLEVLRVIGRAAGPAGMVGGQAIDLVAAGQTPAPRVTLDAEALQQMHARKTGALIRAAAVSGAIMAGGSPQQVAAADAFAIEIGSVRSSTTSSTWKAMRRRRKPPARTPAATSPPIRGCLVERSRQLVDQCLVRASRCETAAER